MAQHAQTQALEFGRDISNGQLEVDYLLVGGGLQNCLVLLALAHYQPKATVLLVEKDDRLGGNHTWSMHAHDMKPADFPWAQSLIEHKWPAYEVRFPSHSRLLNHPYGSISSPHMHNVVMAATVSRSNISVRLETAAELLDSHVAVLSNGLRVRGSVVVDSRGPEHFRGNTVLGYQKFLGLRLRLRRPANRAIPMLMDALVPQTDGFRFFYVLPFEPDRILIEETFYSDNPDLNEDAVTASILTYARLRGYDIDQIESTEMGSLPLPGAVGTMPPPSSPLSGGYAGGWFHPTTGYSLPPATRLADFLARNPASETFGLEWQAQLAAHRKQFRYFVWLNQFLFGTFAPDQRRNVLERFYRLPEETILRFYAMTLTRSDCLRIFIGKPPRGMSMKLAFSKGMGL
ncbi:MAG: hypothetical protein AMXMBFR84_46350 [Candidatus Hydrogenedentota bacterium]